MTQVSPSPGPLALLDSLLQKYWDCAYREGQSQSNDGPGDNPACSTLTDIRALVRSLLTNDAERPTYRVFVRPMEESHRVTYWTTLVSSTRPADAKLWDSAGIITPFMSTELWQAEHEAESWATFLGTTAEPFVQPAWVAEALVRIANRSQSGEDGCVPQGQQ